MWDSATNILVIDASVLINLLATGIETKILSCLTTKIMIPNQVIKEIKRHPRDKSDAKNYLNKLFADNVIQKIELDEQAFQFYTEMLFENDSLGDGELACIAYAATKKINYIVFDDKLGRKTCQQKFPFLKILSSVDLLKQYHQKCEPDFSIFQKILFDAVKIGRMNMTSKQDDEWVREILGESKVKLCPSLKRR
jgi:predicted nucleic acid-binding protein